jgi:phospholipase/carboxylesterase
MSAIERREFLKRATAAAVFLPRSFDAFRWEAPEPGRLSTRPRKPTKNATPGDHVLADDGGRRALLHVPASYDPKRPSPFFLALHGATGSGDSMLRGSRTPADNNGVVVLSPSSRGSTWDAIRGDFRDDVARVDQLLAVVFDRCVIDPARVAIGGFSDGASYALSLGLRNGDLFTHIVAHSPGFVIPGTKRGRPKVFISHGRQDAILPVEQCGRRIANQLQREGYAPRYDEFDGGHTASQEMRDAAMKWFTT